MRFFGKIFKYKENKHKFSFCVVLQLLKLFIILILVFGPETFMRNAKTASMTNNLLEGKIEIAVLFHKKLYEALPKPSVQHFHSPFSSQNSNLNITFQLFFLIIFAIITFSFSIFSHFLFCLEWNSPTTYYTHPMKSLLWQRKKEKPFSFCSALPTLLSSLLLKVFPKDVEMLPKRAKDVGWNKKKERKIRKILIENWIYIDEK